MRFAVDAHAIGRHLTGNEVYVRSLLNAFAALDHDSEFVAYLSVEEARPLVPARFTQRQIAANPFLRLGFDFAMKLRSERPDLLHVQYTAPLGCPVPVVVSVHDVSFLEHPEFFPPLRAMQLRWTVRRTVESAIRILTGTEFSRASILKAYPTLDPDNVVVVPNAAASYFRPVSRESSMQFVRSRYGIAAPFVLCVGDLQPRKNHIALIEGFRRLIRANPQLPHHLLIAGQETWFAPRVREAAQKSGIADRIHFSGFVGDDELVKLYNACELFVFPSLYEGFGLPVLEAMACGRAVTCARASALPEVVDGAAILFDPGSPNEIARAIADLILDAELRARMERLGSQRALHFSWQKTAEKTLEVYYAIAAANRPARRAAAPAQAGRK